MATTDTDKKSLMDELTAEERKFVLQQRLIQILANVRAPSSSPDALRYAVHGHCSVFCAPLRVLWVLPPVGSFGPSIYAPPCLLCVLYSLLRLLRLFALPSACAPPAPRDQRARR